MAPLTEERLTTVEARLALLEARVAELEATASHETEPAVELMSTSEAAELLDVHVNTIKNWIADGKLPAVRIGRSWKVRRSDLDAILQDGG